MSLKKNLIWLAVCLLTTFMLVSCGKKGGQASPQSFDKVAPEIKADWDTAVAADKANDYFTASTSYAKVIRQQSNLTPKQFDSVLAASQALMQRLTAAADSGDAAAKQALAQLMRAQNQR
jgi:predicted small lipoprotein YifL